MKLDKGKLRKALKKGLSNFKKLNKKCKVKYYKEDKLFASVNFGDIYGADTDFMFTVSEDGWFTIEGHVMKVLMIADNDFNYKHKNFFIKSNKSYKRTNYLSVGYEDDLAIILKAYAENMLKGDLYQEWK